MEPLMLYYDNIAALKTKNAYKRQGFRIEQVWDKHPKGGRYLVGWRIYGARS